jgi:hypothetical protein
VLNSAKNATKKLIATPQAMAGVAWGLATPLHEIITIFV